MCNFAFMSILSLAGSPKSTDLWLTDLLKENEARWRDRRELARPADTAVIMFVDLLAA